MATALERVQAARAGKRSALDRVQEARARRREQEIAPSTGERVARGVGGTVGAVAGAPFGLPGMITGGAIGAPAAGEAYRFAESQPELREPMSWLEAVFPFPAAINRLGQAITSNEVVPGSPPPRTTGEVVEDVKDAAIEGGLGGATGYGAGKVLGMGDDAARVLGRGLRTRPEARVAAQEYRASQRAAGVTEEAGTFSTVARELGVAAGYGGAAEVMSGGLTGGGAAIVGALLRLPAATRKLLANNPSFARWALSSGPTAASSAAGAAAGQAAVQTGTFTADQVDRLVSMMLAEGPEVANAIRQLMSEMNAEVRGNSP